MRPELSIERIHTTRDKLKDFVNITPTVRWEHSGPENLFPKGTEVFVKLELFQKTGSFKVRGAMNVIQSLDPAELSRGITAVSAGNHAIAAAYAASKKSTSALIFMPKTARKLRVERAINFGARVILCDTQTEMFERAEEAKIQEGRTFVHPFEGPMTVQGTATVGLEFSEQVSDIDVMILPIGGGGLCAGFSAAIRQIWPNVEIYGVEPEGANTMAISFKSGKTIVKENVNTIADSLAPPKTEPYTFSVCKELVDDIVLVSDDALRDAMQILFYDLRLAVEPAAAATAAALCGPLQGRIAGKRVGIICCGTNISSEDFFKLSKLK